MSKKVHTRLTLRHQSRMDSAAIELKNQRHHARSSIVKTLEEEDDQEEVVSIAAVLLAAVTAGILSDCVIDLDFDTWGGYWLLFKKFGKFSRIQFCEELNAPSWNRQGSCHRHWLCVLLLLLLLCRHKIEKFAFHVF